MALARIVGDILLDEDLFFICGLLLCCGVDSAELVIGDKDGICGCLSEAELWSGGEGVVDRDSARRVYRSKCKRKIVIILNCLIYEKLYLPPELVELCASDDRTILMPRSSGDSIIPLAFIMSLKNIFKHIFLFLHEIN